MSEIGVHVEGLYRNEYGGKIEQVSKRENRQEARQSRKHRARVVKCPSPVKEEADCEPDHIAADIGRCIAESEEPLAQVDGEQADQRVRNADDTKFERDPEPLRRHLSAST